MATAYTPTASGTTVSASEDGGTTFHRVQNITSIDFSNPGKSETTTETLDNDPVVSVGSPQPSDVSIGVQVGAGRGARIVSRAARSAGGDGRVVVKMTTPHKVVIDNATAARTLAIAVVSGDTKAGTVTGVGTKFQSGAWEVGKAIVISNVTYVIETITSDTSLTVYRPDGMNVTAVTATDSWELVEFGLEREFQCEVINGNNASFATGGSPIGDTFTLKSIGVLPEWDLAVS